MESPLFSEREILEMSAAEVDDKTSRVVADLRAMSYPKVFVSFGVPGELVEQPAFLVTLVDKILKANGFCRNSHGRYSYKAKWSGDQRSNKEAFDMVNSLDLVSIDRHLTKAFNEFISGNKHITGEPQHILRTQYAEYVATIRGSQV